MSSFGALLTPGAPSPHDALLLEGMEFYGYHGDLDAERKLGTRFRVDVTLRADLRPAGRSDDLVDTLDYARCFETVREIVEERRFHLLEAVAETIANALLEQQPRTVAVRVRVAKSPPVPGHFQSFGVCIERSRRLPDER